MDNSTNPTTTATATESTMHGHVDDQWIRDFAATNVLIEVRCCCEPENLLGYLPFSVGFAADLNLRFLHEGGIAFDSNDDAAHVMGLEGFTPAANVNAKGNGTKTWKKATDDGVDNVDDTIARDPNCVPLVDREGLDKFGT